MAGFRDDLVPCTAEGCEVMVENDSLALTRHKEHDCLFTFVQCGLQCGQRIQRRNGATHRSTECPNRYVECTAGCDDLVQYRNLLVHTNGYLSKMPRNWDNVDVCHFLNREFSAADQLVVRHHLGKEEFHGSELLNSSSFPPKIWELIKAKLPKKGISVIASEPEMQKTQVSDATNEATKDTREPSAQKRSKSTETDSVFHPDNETDETVVGENHNGHHVKSHTSNQHNENNDILEGNYEQPALPPSENGEHLIGMKRAKAPPPPVTSNSTTSADVGIQLESLSLEKNFTSSNSEPGRIIEEGVESGDHTSCTETSLEIDAPAKSNVDKYEKMLKAGVPKAAVEIARQRDLMLRSGVENSTNIRIDTTSNTADANNGTAPGFLNELTALKKTPLSETKHPSKMPTNPLISSIQGFKRSSLKTTEDATKHPTKMPTNPLISSIQGFKRSSLKKAEDVGMKRNPGKQSGGLVHAIAGFDRKSLRHVENQKEKDETSPMGGLGGALADAIAKRRMLIQGSDDEDTLNDESEKAW